MQKLLRDLNYAFRQLQRAPGFSFMAVLTLALGLGAGSAIFCLMDVLWLHPIHIPHPGQIVRVFSTTPQTQDGYFSYPEYQTLAQRVTAFHGTSENLLAIGRRGSMLARPDGTSRLLLTDVVSSNFFSVLGVSPLIGRVFTPRDAEWMRTHPGVVLGYRCWRQNFAADPNIVGRRVQLMRGKDRRTQVDIWGVLPPSFREIDPDTDRDLWMPAETWAAMAGPSDLASRSFRWFNLLGRLAPGATLQQANSQVAAVAGALASADPVNSRDRGARAISDFRYRMDQAGTSAIILFGIVGGVILLAIMNMIHLLLARALVRSPEMALRMSLGGSRWAITRQLLIENLLLVALSLAAGLGLAFALIRSLPHLLVQQPAMLDFFGSGLSFHLDLRAFVVAASLALLSMLLLALIPLGQVMRPALLPVLQASAVTRTAGKTPLLRRAAVWLQIGISFALLVSTGVLIRSFLNTRWQSIGLTRNQVLVLFAQEPEAPVRDAVLANLSALPGVQHVAYAIRSPLMPSEGGIAAKVTLPSHPELHEPVEIKYNAVSPSFLDLIGTRIMRGRGFAAADDRNGPPVVIISQAMASKYWPDRDPIGQTVRLPGFSNGADLTARIVGVAENAPVNQIGEIPEPYMYLPFHLSGMGEITFVLETQQNAMTLAEDARQVLVHANPLLEPMFVTSLPELIRFSAGNYQMIAELVSALGLIGLTLTVVGLYGFLAFRVTQRRREIGIRMALGASRKATAWLILRDTAVMAAIGLSIGVLLAVNAAHLEASFLFGVRPLDALSLVTAFAMLSLVVVAAAWLPVRRAASVEPMETLRRE